MKNIIVAGPPRSGKTTLAKRINEELNYFAITVDNLVAIFGAAYPQMNIRLNWNRIKTTDNLAPFLGHFLGAFSTNYGTVYDEYILRGQAMKGNRFVLEGFYFNFEKISSILKTYGIEKMKDNFILIGLVYNKKTIDEFINDFKKYDTEDDWTYGWSDNEYREYAMKDAIPLSMSMTEHLTDYGFTIYDTSTEREEIYDKIIEDVKSKL